MLDEIKADPNEVSKGGESALQRAIYRNDSAICKDLLNHGAETEFKFAVTNLTCARYCVIREKPKLLDLLLDYGAELDLVAEELEKQYYRDYDKFKAILFKHERWRRIRSFLKPYSKLNGASLPEDT